jgi:glucose/arabinose dehydrogenase
VAAAAVIAWIAAATPARAQTPPVPSPQAPAPTTVRLSDEVTFTRWANAARPARAYSRPTADARPAGRLRLLTEDGFPGAYLLLASRHDDQPNRHLYVSTGDAGNPASAQDPAALNGKLLALTPRQYHGPGHAAPEIVALGLRNSQGFDWQTGTGRLLANDHGPSGFDGPEGYDEVDEIVPGGNYGWPLAISRDTGGGRALAPLRAYPRPIAPSGSTFVTTPGSRWRGNYLLAALRGAELRRLVLRGGRVVLDRPELRGRYGRLRTVVEGPDGCLYVLTSNRDGRGSPVPRDDRILRVRPPGVPRC